MFKYQKNIGFLCTLIFTGFLFFPFFSHNANAASLVPCGQRSDDPATSVNEAKQCGLCDLIIGIKGIIDWGRNILVVLALTAIVAGGIMYAVSAGNQQMMEAGKGVVMQAFVGMAIVLGAWLIVNTAMWLLATKDGNSDGGVLGIGVTGWDVFTCDVNSGPN